MRNWTTNQNEVITLRRQNLLVSASAGSGKTTVMIERIATMIEKGEAAIDNILIMTFTKESARDMSAKLSKRLGDKFDISALNIGTFHKFCGDLIQSYFNIVGVNPNFTVADNCTITAWQHEILSKIIEEKYSDCKNAIDAFCSSVNPKPLFDIIISINEFLNTRAKPEEWLAKSAFAGYEENLENNIAMRGILTYFQETGRYYLEKFEPTTDCFDWALKLSQVKDYDDIHKVAISFDKLARIKSNASPEEKAIKSAFNDIMKKLKAQYILPKSQMQKNQTADRVLVRQIITLVNAFRENYARIKAENCSLDFSDLEKHALEILTNDSIKDSINFKFIFVDEYQDTNPVQESILALLANDPEAKIFVVGDVKQGIYGFRGTESKIFTDRMNRYQQSLEPGKVIQLNANFRSNKQILAFVNDVFEKIMNDKTCGLDYRTTSRFDIPPTLITDAVEAHVIQKGDTQAEAAVIAQRISQLAKQGIFLSDIAILARNRTHFPVLIETLNQAGINCITDARTFTDDLYEIELLNNMLRCVFDHTYKLPAFMLMQSFVFNFSPEDLSKISLNDCDEKLNIQLSQFNEFQQKYLKLSQTSTVPELLLNFIAEYDIINKLLATPNGERMVRNIYSFLNKLSALPFCDTLENYINMLESGHARIEIQTPPEDSNCVRIMTIHSSKGLEFPIVFIFDTGEPFSSAEKRKLLVTDKKCGLCIYSTDSEENIKHPSIARLGATILANKDQIAEEMRLLYVALTRPKNKLIIVGSAKAELPSSVFPTDYEIMCTKNYLQMLCPAIVGHDFTNIINNDDIEIIKKERTSRVLASKPDPVLTKELKMTFTKRYPYNTNTISHTSVTDEVAQEPHTIERNLEPSNSSGGATYGTLFHRNMQFNTDFDEKTQKCNQVLCAFTKGMTVYRELPFMYKSNDTIVHGIIDFVATDNNRIVLVDYKTTHADETQLIELYKTQLDNYAKALQTAYPSKHMEKFIYSTAHEKLIKV